jgi:hypothetical protein
MGVQRVRTLIKGLMLSVARLDFEPDRERPENFKAALERQPDDIKLIMQFSEA